MLAMQSAAHMEAVVALQPLVSVMKDAMYVLTAVLTFRAYAMKVNMMCLR